MFVPSCCDKYNLGKSEKPKNHERKVRNLLDCVYLFKFCKKNLKKD